MGFCAWWSRRRPAGLLVRLLRLRRLRLRRRKDRCNRWRTVTGWLLRAVCPPPAAQGRRVTARATLVTQARMPLVWWATARSGPGPLGGGGRIVLSCEGRLMAGESLFAGSNCRLCSRLWCARRLLTAVGTVRGSWDNRLRCLLAAGLRLAGLPTVFVFGSVAYRQLGRSGC